MPFKYTFLWALCPLWTDEWVVEKEGLEALQTVGYNPTTRPGPKHSHDGLNTHTHTPPALCLGDYDLEVVYGLMSLLIYFHIALRFNRNGNCYLCFSMS